MEDRSAAREAGIQKGDVIVQLDDLEIKSSTALIEYIGRKRPGDKVNVKVNRLGKEKSFTITLKNREGKLGTVNKEVKNATASLGIELEEVDPKILNKLELNAGVRIKSLENGKIARHTDMREGFIVTHIDDKSVKNSKEVTEILKNKKPGDLITFSGVYEDYPREYIYAIRM
jgi:serine protease Do